MKTSTSVKEFKVQYYYNNKISGNHRVIKGVSNEVIFEDFYNRNNSLKYCNGSYWKFVDEAATELYNEWVKGLTNEQLFRLCYGNGIVD